MSGELSLLNFKAVLFDVDGTLVDSLDKIVSGLGDAIERYAGRRPHDAEIRSLVGLPLRIQFARYSDRELSREEIDERIDYAITRYQHHKHLERVFEPAIEALRLCHQAGIKTGLVTSKNAREMQIFNDDFVGKDYVDVAVCASDVSKPKPDPEGALRACELLGVRPEDAVLIGDAVFDMQSARAAGITPVAVAYGSASAKALQEEMPALLLETPEDLLAWVRQSLLQTTCPERKRL